MTVVTTRPDATVSAGSSTVTGAASRHAATSDDSDSSYVTLPSGDSLTLGFVEPTIPAGGMLCNYGVKVRAARDTSTTPLLFATNPGGGGSAWFVVYATPSSYLPSMTPSTSEISPAEATLNAVYAAVHIYEIYLETAYAAKPTLNVTAPTGTVTDTNIPTVTWTETLDGSGGARNKCQVKIFSAAQYGAGGFDPSTSTATYSSGTLSGTAPSHALTTPLADGTYRAYVRVAQTINGLDHWSDWDYEGFVMDATYPDTPSITLTAQASDGRIKVDLDDAATTPTTDMFEVQVSRDGGTTWEAMRLLTDEGGYVAPVAGLATVYDYEAANGVATYYRARALHESSGVYAASAWVSANATWSSASWWIKHPNQPALNLAVVPYGLDAINRGARQGVFEVPGRSLPVVVSDSVRSGATGTVTFLLESDADRDALAALLDTCDTLLLQGRGADYWDDRYVRFGEHSSARAADKAYVADTVETLPWTEVDSPAGVVEDWSA